MKPITQLILILLLTFTVVPVYGEDEGEVYYCSDIDGNGFDKESDSYKRSGFNPEKFKLKFNPANKNIKISHNAFGEQPVDLFCTVPYPDIKPMGIACTNEFYMFNFNSTNGRYVLSLGYGHVVGDSDSFVVFFGKWDNF